MRDENALDATDDDIIEIASEQAKALFCKREGSAFIRSCTDLTMARFSLMEYDRRVLGVGTNSRRGGGGGRGEGGTMTGVTIIKMMFYDNNDIKQQKSLYRAIHSNSIQPPRQSTFSVSNTIE
eukprot:scaffold190335_cov73-Cyclotella_meneghiniana.AAC.1